MADLTAGNIYQNAFKTLQSVLVNNVTDPKNRYKTPIVKTKRVFTSDVGFCGYPYIFLPPFDIGQSRETNDRSKAQKNFEVRIEVWGDQDDLNSFDVLSDEIDRILNDQTARQTMMDAGLKMGRITSTDTFSDFDDGKPVWVRRLIIEFSNLLNVR